MHHKLFGGRAPPGPAGGTYSTPQDPLVGLRSGYTGRAEERVDRGQGRGGEGWRKGGWRTEKVKRVRLWREMWADCEKALILDPC